MAWVITEVETEAETEAMTVNIVIVIIMETGAVTVAIIGKRGHKRSANNIARTCSASLGYRILGWLQSAMPTSMSFSDRQVIKFGQ